MKASYLFKNFCGGNCLYQIRNTVQLVRLHVFFVCIVYMQMSTDWSRTMFLKVVFTSDHPCDISSDINKLFACSLIISSYSIIAKPMVIPCLCILSSFYAIVWYLKDLQKRVNTHSRSERGTLLGRTLAWGARSLVEQRAVLLVPSILVDVLQAVFLQIVKVKQQWLVTYESKGSSLVKCTSLASLQFCM
jgi:hypothetical protein